MMIKTTTRGVVIVLILALAVLAGCGGSNVDETAFTPAGGTESPYCDTYRAWQVHELDGDGDDQPTAAALRSYWDDYLEFNKTALEQAPAEIRDEWVVSEGAVRTILTPVLEKYDFDAQRIAEEGTATEQAVGEPPPDVQKAQAAIHAYEERVCGLASPAAADVVFKADSSPKAYCVALGKFNGELARIESSRFDPEVLRAFVTSDEFTAALDTLEEAAPEAIRADQEASSEWWRTRWSDVIGEFDYDVRGIWVDGTPEDRAVLTFSHPDLAEHDSRLTAYEEQVCGRRG